MLDLVKRADDYVIYQDDQPLLTPGGRVVEHTNGRLLKHILTDMLIVEGASRVISFNLFSFEKDNLCQGNDPVSESMVTLMNADPFARIKTGMVSCREESEPLMPEKQINLSFWIFSELLSIVNDFFEDRLKTLHLPEGMETPFSDAIRLSYQDLADGQKSAVNLLVKEHASGIVLPLLLVLNKISPAEYAKGMIALTGGHPGDKNGDRIILDASAVRDYLLTIQAAEATVESVDEIIRKGENDRVEFKSTLRWDLRAMKTNPSIERASLKSISAFLNSNGGILVIGVRDDGSTEGVEADALQTDDRWMLHLWNLIHGTMGKEISKFIHTRWEKRDGKTICLVECIASPRPVFLRQKGFPEEFFIRVGPSSTTLTVSEALTYIADHFPR